MGYGRYCCIPHCYSNDDPDYIPKVGFLKFPTLKRDDYVLWKKSLIDILTKYRVLQPDDYKRIEKGNMFICTLHFEEKDMYLTETGRKKVDIGALPKLNLPTKSHETPKPIERRPLVRTLQPAPVSKKDAYKDFEDFEKRVGKLKLARWVAEKVKRNYHFKLQQDESHIYPKFELLVDQELQFTLLAYGWALPSDHSLYQFYNRSLKTVTISSLLQEIHSFNLCEGLPTCFDSCQKHFLPSKIDTSTIADGCPTQASQKTYFRAKDCMLLFKSKAEVTCSKCENVRRIENRDMKRKVKLNNTPAHKFAPLSQTSKHRVELALKEERKAHKATIARMQKEIASKGVTLNSPEMSEDFFTIMENHKNVTPFMKLFWEQQKLNAKGNPKAIRYHPMIIRFCISLAAKSSSAYDELRSSGILTLPSRRTLRDYTNFIKPLVGFNPQVTAELIRTTKNSVGHQRFICLTFDEIKVQENLVFDKYTGDLVGFVDLGDADLNFSTFQDPSRLASYVMVFYVRALASKLKFSFSYFGTNGMTAHQIMSIFWEAVAILELTCKLPVICAVADGNSSNRKFFKMHGLMDDALSDVVYRSINLFAEEERYLYFFADPPHLIKTARNCLFHSGDGKSRHMRNSDGCLVWDHIKQVAFDDFKRGNKQISKISLDHVELNSYSIMKVSLAAQVLSSSMAGQLHKYPGATATAEYCLNLNRFFDCLNVRCEGEGVHDINVFAMPYYTTHDWRYEWLETNFLGYLDKWKNDLRNHPGNIEPKDQERMYISRQTDEGLRISVRSLIETSKYVLGAGFRYFASGRITQDVAEEHFMQHRRLGGTSSNPSVYSFGYQENQLRLLGNNSLMQVTGNSSGAHNKRKGAWGGEVSDEKMPKRASEKGLF